MGLDCYVFTANDSGNPEDTPDELWYGRKENEIHGWMQRQSSIPADKFNCKEFPLTQDLLDAFQLALNKGELVPTAGFFFGGPGAQDQVREAAEELIQATQQALNEGKQPYYFSWW